MLPLIRWMTFAVCVGLMAPLVRGADDDDPIFQMRPLSEWIELLRGGKDQPGRLVAPHVIGSPGGMGIIWAGPVNNRRAALLVLELIGPIRSVKVLPATSAALRDDPSELIRQAAAQAIGRMCVKARMENIKLDRVRDALIGALRNDRSGRVREAAAHALARFEAEAEPAVAALAAALGDNHPGTRTAAAEALRRIGKEARDALPELQKMVRNSKADLLARLQATLALGRIGGPEAVPALTEMVADKAAPAELRKAAAEALGNLGKDGALSANTLAAVLLERDAGPELRRAAAHALDQLGLDAKPALSALKKALKDEDKFVRCFAMHALGQLGKESGSENQEIVTGLLQGLNDGVAEVRLAAIEALAVLGPVGLGGDLAAVRERLKETLRDGQKPVRDAANDALKKLTPS